ncbi:HNH endonuclease [Priestia megaterium]|uniref:HNH endonuclease n=1 Tax=Priestia megaterium TaxID=1404 RepID=UPI0039EB1ACB
MERIEWLQAIFKAFKELGGKGTLEDVYSMIEYNSSLPLDKYTDWKAQIRKTIYLHSSDCEVFKGRPNDKSDIFYSLEGKGTGGWGIRDQQSKHNNTFSLEYPFIEGQVYKRSYIHDLYGGNRQRGIAASKDKPMIFIFSGKEGKTYGYEDGWQDENTFFYTGEGQIGNQEFKEGNKALKDHIENSKDIYLLESLGGKGLYRFVSQLTCIGYHFAQGIDKLNNSRTMIIFEFEKTNKVSQDSENIEKEIESTNLEELRKLAKNAANNSSTMTTLQERKTTIRKRGAAIKKYALVRAEGICEACEQFAPFYTTKDEPFLEVHHLTRLSDGGLDHPEHVAAICPNCHKRVHHSKDGKEYNDQLIKKIKEKELAYN